MPTGNPNPRIVHLLPDFRVGAPLAFILDIVKMVPEYYHVLLTTTSPEVVGVYHNELCFKLNLEVLYTESPVTEEALTACRSDVVLMYDVGAADLESADIVRGFSTVYYAHYRNDVTVSRFADERLYGVKQLLPDPDNEELYFPPYVRHQTVIDACVQPVGAGRKRTVAILAGNADSYDYQFTADFINGIDLGRVLVIAPDLRGRSRSFDAALQKARRSDSILLCPHVLGAHYNAYRRMQTMIATGCFRMEAECGVLHRPLIRKPDSVEEAIETVTKSLVNRRLVDEMIDYGRLQATQRQLDLHIHKLHNLVRRLF